MSLNSLNPFISSNALSSLDSNSTLGAGSGAGSTDSSDSTPKGEQFSVFFERMMHPAFNSNAASNPASSTPTQSTYTPDSDPSNPLPLTTTQSLDASLTASSTWGSAQALLDSQSQAFSFGQSYLGVSTQSFPDNSVSNSNTSSSVLDNEGTSNADSPRNERLDSNSSPNPTADSVREGTDSEVRNTADSKRKDPATSNHITTHQDPSKPQDVNAEALSTNGSDESSNANPDSDTGLSDAQKLQLANQSLLDQRLPNGTAEVLHPAALKTKVSSDIKLPSDIKVSSKIQVSDNELSTIALGPNSQIVTSTKNPPTEKSLSAFAKSMGFSKTAIAKLFGTDDAEQSDATTATTQSVLTSGVLATAPNDPNALATGSTLTASALSSSSLALNTAAPLDAATVSRLNNGTPLNPLSQLPSLNANTLGAKPGPAIDPGLDAGAPLASTTLPGATTATLLNPLSGTLNANLVSANTLTGTTNANLGDLNELMMQNGASLKSGSINFASTLNALSQAGASTSGPSTLSVLNMTGSELTGSAIEALQSEFNKLTNSSLASSTGSDSSAFGLALTPDSNSLNTGVGLSAGLDLGANTSGQTSNPSSSIPNPSDTTSQLNANGTSNVGNMADTYEKLSNQLTAELSSRMNEQISQGQWKMKFALKPSSLGAVDVQIEMKDGKLAANFQADNALTQSLLQHGSNQLKDNLKGLGLTQTDVQVGQNQTQSGGGQQSGSNFKGQNPFAQVFDAQVTSTNSSQDSSPPVDVSIKGASPDGNLDLFA